MSGLGSLRLAPETVAQIQEHAVREYRDECCGVVLESADGRQRVVPLRNVQDELHARDPERYPRTARTAYVPDSAELLEALRLARRPGWRLLAFYHSHPDHGAYFSEEDLAQATPFGEPSYPEAAQIVVSVREGTPGELKAYGWSERERSYVELPVRIE